MGWNEPTLWMRHEAVHVDQDTAVRVVEVVAAHVGCELVRVLRSVGCARQAVGRGHDQLTWCEQGSARGNAIQLRQHKRGAISTPS